MLFFFQWSGHPPDLHSFPTRRSSDLAGIATHPEILEVLELLGFDTRDLGVPIVARRMFDVDGRVIAEHDQDRKSTRLNSSHPSNSYAVFCLKKKTKLNQLTETTVRS